MKDDKFSASYSISQIQEFCKKRSINTAGLEKIKDDVALRQFFFSSLERMVIPNLIIHNDPEIQAALAQNPDADRERNSHEWVNFFFTNIKIIYDDIPKENVETKVEKTEESEPAPTKQENIASGLIDELDQIFANVPENRITAANVRIREMTIYSGAPIEYNDNFTLKCMANFQPYTGLIAITAQNSRQIMAVGHQEQDREKRDEYHLIFAKDDIDFAKLSKNRALRLLMFDQAIADCVEKKELYKGLVYAADFAIKWATIPIVDNVLCIDFGTSNTTAGSYGLLNPRANDVEIVEFTDTTDSKKLKKLYPTVVYVKDCKDPQNIQYLFGYEAKQAVIDHDYMPRASAFFEIKRWLGSLDEIIEIQDEDGSPASVPRYQIILAYLKDVIAKSESYFKKRFKNIHLSAPVKQMRVFCEKMRGLLRPDGLDVEEDCIDESIAVVYNEIRKILEKQDAEDGVEKNIMIIDCGGGTTDMASCSFKTIDSGASTGRALEITTQFLNGDINYGGNNITYSILKILKIKLAQKYNAAFREEFADVDLIPFEESVALTMIDEDDKKNSPVSSVTKLFDQCYTKTEDVVPTKFVENIYYPRETMRNYYYLWQIAEKLKISFYENLSVAQIGFSEAEDRDLIIDDEHAYYLYIYEDGNLVKKEHPFADIKMTVREVMNVITIDIYKLLKKLLRIRDKNTRFDYTAYDYYKLSGQSCKISRFIDLLKEFIPGRQLRRPGNWSEKSGEDKKNALKLNCVAGCVNYQIDRKIGRIDPFLKVKQPKLIYNVFIDRGDRQPELLKIRDEDYIAIQQYTASTNMAQYIIKNSNGEMVNNPRVYFNDTEDLRKMELVDIMAQTVKDGSLSADAASYLENSLGDALFGNDNKKEVYITFAVPAKNGYGLNIFRIRKSKAGDKYIYENYPIIFCLFEDETVEQFFDGSR